MAKKKKKHILGFDRNNSLSASGPRSGSKKDMEEWETYYFMDYLAHVGRYPYLLLAGKTRKELINLTKSLLDKRLRGLK